MNALRTILILTSSLLIFFFVYPLLVLFYLGARQIASAFAVPSFVASLEVTLLISTLAALISLALGTPLGYVLARYEFRFKDFVDALVDVPIMIPHIIVGIMVVLAFASNLGAGPLMAGAGIGVINTVLGATLAVTFVSATYTVRVIQSAVTVIDPNTELTARTLGASPIYTFVKVVLPQIRKALASGAIIAWARSISEVGALFVVAYYVNLGGRLVYPASIFIYESYISTGLAEAIKFSAAMVLVSLGVFVVYRLVIRQVPESRR